MTTELKTSGERVSKFPTIDFCLVGLFHNPTMKARKKVIKIIESEIVGRPTTTAAWSSHVLVRLKALKYIMEVCGILLIAPAGY